MPLAIGAFSPSPEDSEDVDPWWIQAPADNTGASTTEYQPKTAAKSKVENASTGRRGALVSFYDPEIAAALRGEL